MTIEEILSFLRERGDQFREPVPVDGLEPMTFKSTLAPGGISASELTSLVPECPQDLHRFWSRVAWVRLFEDRVYGQWGLHLLSPEEARNETEKQKRLRPNEYLARDLVIGCFLGDSDLLICQCDQSRPDYGQIVLALPIDPRGDWPTVGRSLVDFLDAYIRARGAKFWEARPKDE